MILILVINIFYVSHLYRKTFKTHKQTSKFKHLKIFCIILTKDDEFSYPLQKLVYEIWANKCTDYRFIMTIPKHLNLDSRASIESGIEFEIDNLKYLHPPGFKNDTYLNLSEKVFMAFKYIYNKYKDFDWYLKADDDTYIFMNNLRNFLSNKNISSPVTYGYDLKVSVPYGYHSGGAGYVLSKEAFLRFGRKLNSGDKDCYDYVNAEDMDVGFCLRKVGVYPNKSLDDEGKERFHIFNHKDHYEISLNF